MTTIRQQPTFTGGVKRTRQGVALALTLMLAAGTQVLAQERVDPAQEQNLIVAFDGPPQTAAVLAVGGRVRMAFPLIHALAIRAPAAAVASLRANPHVRYVEVDERVVDRAEDSDRVHGMAQAKGGNHGGLPSPQVTPWGVIRVGAPEAWATSRGAGVRVMVLDSGIGPNSDLAIAGGINFVNLAGNSEYSDAFGHGTQVAGVIAALDNDVAVVGVAPECELYAVRVRATNEYEPSWIVAGIDWSVANGAHVINLSGGTSINSQAVADALAAARDAGVTLVTAAGNGGQGGSAPIYPAAHPGVLAVGNIDEQEQIASSSSAGYWLDLLAPGENTLTLAPNELTSIGGATSMSSPHGAGVAALVWGALLADPQLSQLPRSVQGAVVQQALLRTADDWTAAPCTPGWDPNSGHGIVNAVAAVGLPPARTNDIAITAFNGPTSGAPNETVGLWVAITNLGAVTEPAVQVSLIEDPNGSAIVQTAPLVADLGPGDTTTVPFTVTLANNPGSSELFTALAQVGTDEDPSNNSANLVVPIGPTQPFADVVVSYEYSRKKLTVTLDVRSGGSPLVGATVSYELRHNKWVSSGTLTTDSSGQASFVVNNPGTGLYTTDVTAVVGSNQTVYVVSLTDPGYVR